VKKAGIRRRWKAASLPKLMTKSSTRSQCGALPGLALLVCGTVVGDDALPGQIHRDIHKAYKHHSYMLIQDGKEVRLYLFGNAVRVEYISSNAMNVVDTALLKVHSANPRIRVRGLTELAGSESQAALDAALGLLNDPSLAVREEAKHLILDHPHGADMVSALGLVDKDREE